MFIQIRHHASRRPLLQPLRRHLLQVPAKVFLEDPSARSDSGGPVHVTELAMDVVVGVFMSQEAKFHLDQRVDDGHHMVSFFWQLVLLPQLFHEFSKPMQRG